MSVVTNCILSFDIGENEQERLKEINSFFKENQGFIVLDSSACGGTKCLEKPILIGAFNHLGVYSLMEHLIHSVNWEYPENVQLMVCDQDEDKFSISELDNWS